MHHTTLFKSNRSQAVRLAKDVAFPDHVHDVVVLKEGHRRIIVPSTGLWDDFFASPELDLPDRDQPEAQEREPL